VLPRELLVNDNRCIRTVDCRLPVTHPSSENETYSASRLETDSVTAPISLNVSANLPLNNAALM
jgi:hypothetical protein